MLGREVAREVARGAHGAEFERVLTPERLGFYADHVVNGQVWSPGASQLQLMAAAAMLLEQPRAESAGLEPGTSVELADVVLPQPLRLAGDVTVRCTIASGTAEVQAGGAGAC